MVTFTSGLGPTLIYVILLSADDVNSMT